MVNTLLAISAQHNITELERIAIEKHQLSNGYYFMLSLSNKDGKLSEELGEPLVIMSEKNGDGNGERTAKERYYEDFTARDFYATAEPKKEIDCPKKKMRTIGFYCAGCKGDKPLNEGDERNFEMAKNSIIKADTRLRKLLPAEQCPPPLDVDKMSLYFDILEQKMHEVFDVAKKMAGKSLSDTVVVKVFTDAPIEDYRQEYLRYAYTCVYDKDIKPIKNDKGELLLASSFNISYNIKKPFINPQHLSRNSSFMATMDDLYRVRIMSRILLSLARDAHWRNVYLKFDDDLSGNTTKENGNYRFLMKNDNGNPAILDFSAHIPTPMPAIDLTILNHMGYKTLKYVGKNLDSIINGILRYKYDENFPNYCAENSANKDGKDANPQTASEFKAYNDMLRSFVLSYGQNLHDRFRVSEDCYDRKAARALYRILIGYVRSEESKFSAAAYVNLYYDFNRKEMRIMQNHYSSLSSKIDRPFSIEDDGEYSFLAGQMISYLAGKTTSDSGPQRVLSKLSMTDSDIVVKSKLRSLLRQYAHGIERYSGYTNSVAALFEYIPTKLDGILFVAGLYHKNLFNVRECARKHDKEGKTNQSGADAVEEELESCDYMTEQTG